MHVRRVSHLTGSRSKKLKSLYIYSSIAEQYDLAVSSDLRQTTF